jgi:hypothetical protein
MYSSRRRPRLPKLAPRKLNSRSFQPAAHAQDQSTITEHVQGRSMLGNQNWLALGHDEHGRSDPHPIGEGGDVGQPNRRLQDCSVRLGLVGGDQNVVSGPDRVVAERLRFLGGAEDSLA